MVVKLMILFVLCNTASAVSHLMKYLSTGSSGVPNISEHMTVAVIDGMEVAYCDSSKKILEPRQDWVKKVFHDNPGLLEGATHECFENLPNIYRTGISNVKQQLNQSAGVHILQSMSGCKWDENSGEVTGFLQLGYNGEGVFEFDPKTMTWSPLKPVPRGIKQMMDGDRNLITFVEIFLTKLYPEALKMLLDYGSSSLKKTVFPSVSLLQKTPSSPISCHATGFYPERVMMFWRKDEVEIHEGVDPEEILPNNDGTFQIRVDLNVSSVTAEDWSRYDCVFHLSGVENIITKLDKTLIRSNKRERAGND